MSKRYIIQSIAYLVCVLSLVTASGGGGVAFAEGRQESGSFLEGQAVSESVGDAHNDTRGDAVISFAVNVYNARYSEISENNRDFTLEFDLSNDGDVQPQVKYIVELQQKVGDRYIVADQRPYDDVISLAKGQVVHKKITYSIPNALTGDFRVMIIAANDKGMPYGGISVGEVSVTDHIPGIVINTDSCFLAIEGDPQKYPLMNGTDIHPQEAIFLQCDKVTNTADFDMTFQPRFFTRERTMFGRIVSEAEGAPEVMAAGVTKSLRFPLTVQEKPQSYQMSLFFADAQGDAITNTVSVRYVTRGESATAQNVSLDKDRYAQGDTAVITALVTGNAHDFPDARFAEHNVVDTQQQHLIAAVMLRDAHGIQCTDSIEQGVSAQDGVIALHVPIIKDCEDPYVVLTIKNEDHTVLDENTFSVESQVVQKSQPKISFTQMFYYGVLIATVVVVLGIVIYSFMKRRKGGRFSLFFALYVTAAALFGGGYEVYADSASVSYFGNDSWANVSMAYVTTKDTYCAGEEVVAGAAMSINTCANILALYKVYINGAVVADGSKDMGSDHKSVTKSLVSNAEKNLGRLSVGTHTIPFRFIAQRNRNGKIITFADKTYYKTITVKDCTPPKPPVVVVPPRPSCILSFSPSSGYVPYSGSVSLRANNHVGTPTVTCTGTLTPGGKNTISLAPGTYDQNFSVPGAKTCVATVKNAAGVTSTCTGSLTVQPRPEKPTCSLSFSPSSGTVPYNGAVTLTAQNFTGTPTATCAGTLTPGGRNTIPLLPGRHEQVFNYAGYKDCSVTVRNVIGETAQCSASLRVTENVQVPLCGPLGTPHSSAPFIIPYNGLLQGISRYENSGVPSWPLRDVYGVDRWCAGAAIRIIKPTYPEPGELASWTCVYEITGQDPDKYNASYVIPESNIKKGAPRTVCYARRLTAPTPPPVSVGCTGALPPNAIVCPSDHIGLSVTMPWQKVDVCTDARKCEYTIRDTVSATCTGSLPPHATMCPGDNSGVSTNISWRKVNACTDTQKCEYTEGPYACEGEKNVICGSDTAICPGDTNSTATTQGVQWIKRDAIDGCTSDRACECYKATITPPPPPVTEGDDKGRMIETRP